MLNQYPGLSLSPRRRDASVACYGVIVVFFSLLLFCVLAASVSVVKACAFTGMAALFFGIIGWFAPGMCANQSGTSAPGELSSVQLERCACRRVDAPINALPTYGHDGGVSAGGLTCSVCLEDVQSGEMVRQLPACKHLFHVECIDMWLYSNRTCPLCRCDVWPQRITAKAAAAAESSADALPPV